MFPKKKVFSTSRIKYQLLSCYIVQNFFKNVLTFHIISWILFIRRRPNSQSREQPYMLLILYCQYHAWWCPGSLGRQGISRHGIDEISWNIPSLASEEFICLTKSSPAVNATTTVPLFCFFPPVQDPTEYVTFYGLRTHTDLLGTLVGWIALVAHILMA